MKTTWHNNEYAILARVHPFFESWLGEITVSRAVDLKGGTLTIGEAEE